MTPEVILSDGPSNLEYGKPCQGKVNLVHLVHPAVDA